MPFKKSIDPSAASEGFSLIFPDIRVNANKTYQVIIEDISRIPKRTTVTILSLIHI